MDDTGEPQGMVDPASADQVKTASSAGEETLDAGETDRHFTDLEEEPGTSDMPTEEQLPPAFQLTREPRSRPAPKRFLTVPTFLLGIVCLTAGLLTGYFWQKPVQKPVAPDAAAGSQRDASPLTAADQNDLDEAYAARHAHHYAEAERIFAELGHRHADWGSIQVEIGRTLFYANNSSDAIVALRKSIEKGWKPAEANFLLGVLNKARKTYPDAEANFANAVQIDPTEPEYYFFWGECLREQGKLLDATVKFRSALLRNQYETATGLYRAKLWLCAIEADQAASNGIDSEIDAALARIHPPMEAFLAAAARDLKAGDFHAAAAHFASASQRADPVVFRYIISDPFFADARSKPEFAEFFQLEPPAASPKVEAGASAPTSTATP